MSVKELRSAYEKSRASVQELKIQESLKPTADIKTRRKVIALIEHFESAQAYIEAEELRATIRANNESQQQSSN